jgi:hypothetical protein
MTLELLFIYGRNFHIRIAKFTMKRSDRLTVFIQQNIDLLNIFNDTVFSFSFKFSLGNCMNRNYFFDGF